MALVTGGTTAQTSLLGLKWLPGNLLPADVAQFNANVKQQINPAKLIYPGAGLAGAATYDMTTATLVLKMDASGNAWVC